MQNVECRVEKEKKTETQSYKRKYQPAEDPEASA